MPAGPTLGQPATEVLDELHATHHRDALAQVVMLYLNRTESRPLDDPSVVSAALPNYDHGSGSLGLQVEARVRPESRR